MGLPPSPNTRGQRFLGTRPPGLARSRHRLRSHPHTLAAPPSPPVLLHLGPCRCYLPSPRSHAHTAPLLGSSPRSRPGSSPPARHRPRPRRRAPDAALSARSPTAEQRNAPKRSPEKDRTAINRAARPHRDPARLPRRIAPRPPPLPPPLPPPPSRSPHLASPPPPAWCGADRTRARSAQRASGGRAATPASMGAHFRLKLDENHRARPPIRSATRHAAESRAQGRWRSRAADASWIRGDRVRRDAQDVRPRLQIGRQASHVRTLCQARRSGARRSAPSATASRPDGGAGAAALRRAPGGGAEVAAGEARTPASSV